MKTNTSDTKKIFRKKGACSNTFFHILNREFGHTNETAERASDPLAGGILQQGYQCGMLWGSALAVGAESFRRHDDHDQAIGTAIGATQRVMKSFINRTKTTECYDLTECDFSSKLSMAKYMFTGKFMSCFQLAEDWAPEAIEAAREGLTQEDGVPETCLSCASDVAKRNGATDEEMVTVAGFAGGLGLSGQACGALGAAIWLKNLERCRTTKKTSYKFPEADEIMERFYAATDYEILCPKISGTSFDTAQDHTDFLRSGGCEKVMSALSQ